ncbi:MAG TPA: SDR family NAD(P)-dependent oxidoreductase [Patescibacteria group bacterium]|nr:SDR family NAD(P)-dependent oxidoreductase [Patescibacteria group bacterium]
MKTILITGASSGIGRHTAYQFAKNNDKLILTFRQNENEMQVTKNTCLEYGAKSVEIFQLDLSDNQSINKFVLSLKEKQVGIDVLINNAATILWKTLEEQTFLDIESQIRTNLEGTIKLTQGLLPIVQQLIINIGSKMGKFTRADLPVYCATKFGLRGFTQALAQSETRLSVYCVNPYLTATKMSRYKGRDPQEIASLIFHLVTRKKKPPSGSDIDAWENGS